MSEAGPVPGVSPLIIFGTGGHGKVVLDTMLAAGLCPAVITDDHPSQATLLGRPITPAENIDWNAWHSFSFLVAIGANSARWRIFGRLIKAGGQPMTIRHPFSYVSPTARVGGGCVLCAGTVIHTESEIGPNCIINTAASVDHDCLLGASVHLCPGVRLAGGVRVGTGTMIGAGGILLPGVTVGRDCVVGAGAVVNRDLPDGVVAWGVPARVRHYGKDAPTDQTVG